MEQHFWKSTTYLFAFFVFRSKSWVRDPGFAKPKPTTGFQNRRFHESDLFFQQTLATHNSIHESDLSLKTLHFHLVWHVEIVVVWSCLTSFHVRDAFFVQLNFIGNLLNEVFGMHFGVGFPGVVPRSLQFLICKEQILGVISISLMMTANKIMGIKLAKAKKLLF